MPGAGVASWTPPLPPGLGIPATGSMPDTELALNADVQPEPTIASVTPAAGSIAGGSEVTILGSDFSGATAVRFGLVPALSFSVLTDTRILAISPPGSKPGPVDAVVTTPAGTTGALPPDRYTYTACVVPKLKHRSLKAAKKLLRRRECRPGRVTRAYGAKKSARVVRQGHKPKSILPPGSKVSIRIAG
ncbi:MAG: IPT/TIG domain-containing protein [Thermoleophilia bacterium]|nr:IPT/TIG domain-containing protein [Thermoleophilia bacterium]